MTSQKSQKQQQATVSASGVEAQWREIKAILYAVATTDASRVNPFAEADDEWEPECPYCTGGMDLDAPFHDGATATTSVDGIRHAPLCVVARARTLVARLWEGA